MRDILGQIEKWWDAGETFGLATVVRTFHSAPREPGAALAVSAGGEVIGSVSGGCVEGAVYELAQQVLQTGEPVLQRYGVSDDTALSVGLTCGGIIDIFVEPVSKERYPQLGEVAAAITAGRPVAVATVIAGPGQAGARRVISGDAAGRHAGRRGPARPGRGRRRARDARPGADRRAPLRRARRAPPGRAVGVRPVVRAAAPDAGLRGHRLRGGRRAGREVPRLPGHRVRRPAGVRDPAPGSPTPTRSSCSGRTGTWPARRWTSGR